MTDWSYDRTWYHGSPLELTILRQGSTITQDRRLAEAFSHKPPLVSVSDDGAIKHNGVAPGYLYSIAERVEADDVSPHPCSSMEYDKEWLTNRDLRVALIESVPLAAEELLTVEEIQELQKANSEQRADG